MLHKFVITTPDNSRDTFKVVRATLTHFGFEISRFHSRITDTGMTLVATVRHCADACESAGREALGALPDGSTLCVLPW